HQDLGQALDQGHGRGQDLLQDQDPSQDRDKRQDQDQDPSRDLVPEPALDLLLDVALLLIGLLLAIETIAAIPAPALLLVVFLLPLNIDQIDGREGEIMMIEIGFNDLLLLATLLLLPFPSLPPINEFLLFLLFEVEV